MKLGGKNALGVKCVKDQGEKEEKGDRKGSRGTVQASQVNKTMPARKRPSRRYSRVSILTYAYVRVGLKIGGFWDKSAPAFRMPCDIYRGLN